MSIGKAPLDNRGDAGPEGRAERYAEIERRNGGEIGRKEMTLTRNRREEDPSKKAERFLDIERRSAG